MRNEAYETTIFQWQEGERRVAEAQPRERLALELVRDRIVAELRRRLGGRFSSAELADLYTRGTDWCLDIAIDTVPDHPRAWEAQTVTDAAFARYLRESVDFAGGLHRPR